MNNKSNNNNYNNNNIKINNIINKEKQLGFTYGTLVLVKISPKQDS